MGAIRQALSSHPVGAGLLAIAFARTPSLASQLLQGMDGFWALGQSGPNVNRLGLPPPLAYAASQRFEIGSMLWVVVFYLSCC